MSATVYKLTADDLLAGHYPRGICQCGCGQPTPVVQRSQTGRGWVKGTPHRFLQGHGRRTPLHENIVTNSNGCWEWVGSRSTGGYGRVGWGNRRVQAHRVIYEVLVGSIPQGLQLDHLCRNRGCVNPAHLEPVTQSENQRRGLRSALRALPSECSRGHALAGPNLRITPRGGRRCRTCHRENAQVSRERKAADGAR